MLRNSVGWEELHYSKSGKVCQGAVAVELQA